MKIDYLKEGNAYCPLIRLYEFDGAEAQRLLKTFEALANGAVERVRLDGVESMDGTQITFVRAARDLGVVETGLHQFEVVLEPMGWRETAGLTEPFSDGSIGWQWLTRAGSIQLLLSKDGRW